MKHELDLIKKKAVIVMDSTTNQEAASCLVDIAKLANKCLNIVNQIENNVAAISKDTQQTTTKLLIIKYLTSHNLGKEK